MEENQRLKKQLASGGGGVVTAKAAPQKGDIQPKRDFKSMRAARKEQASTSIEEFN
jgi:hypothetical protein